MKLAFCLTSYHPFGGMQRDFFKISQACAFLGHEIYVFTRLWEGQQPHWINLTLLPNTLKTNHSSVLKFSKDCQKKISEYHFDRVIGFNKMPGLDFYYAADSCFISKSCYQKFPFLRLTSRYKIYAALEKTVFSKESKTKILAISPSEIQNYIHYYDTPRHQIFMLPPGVERNRKRSEKFPEIREAIRQEFSISKENFLILSIGSSYRTKGIDRSLIGFAALPNALREKSFLMLVGKEKNIKRYKKLAKKLNITQSVFFLESRHDIPELLWASDLLLHSSRVENAGIAIAEALVAGVPVLVTENCGYSFLVRESKAGKIIPHPFKQKNLNALLEEMLDQKTLSIFSINALNYTQKKDFHGLVPQSVKLITA